MANKERGESMTCEQIARAYRTAKSKTKQIEILAEIEHLSKERICEILVEQGETLPGKGGRQKKLPAKTEEKKPVKRQMPKVADVPDDIAAEEIAKGTIEEKAPVENKKPEKLRSMPEAVYTALHNELLRLDRELAEILRRKQEIREYFYEEGVDIE